MTNVGTGFRLLPETGDSGDIGPISVSVLDLSFTADACDCGGVDGKHGGVVK